MDWKTPGVQDAALTAAALGGGALAGYGLQSLSGEGDWRGAAIGAPAGLAALLAAHKGYRDRMLGTGGSAPAPAVEKAVKPAAAAVQAVPGETEMHMALRKKRHAEEMEKRRKMAQDREDNKWYKGDASQKSGAVLSALTEQSTPSGTPAWMLQEALNQHSINSKWGRNGVPFKAESLIPQAVQKAAPPLFKNVKVGYLPPRVGLNEEIGASIKAGLGRSYAGKINAATLLPVLTGTAVDVKRQVYDHPVQGAEAQQALDGIQHEYNSAWEKEKDPKAQEAIREKYAARYKEAEGAYDRVSKEYTNEDTGTDFTQHDVEDYASEPQWYRGLHGIPSPDAWNKFRSQQSPREIGSKFEDMPEAFTDPSKPINSKELNQWMRSYNAIKDGRVEAAMQEEAERRAAGFRPGEI